jgi:uncharacterized membrane protein YedE/YeeE
MDRPQACVETPSQTQSFVANLKYLAVGLVFGFVLVKSEVVSWYRIQEMFRFQSFHMYGVIGTAVLVALVSVWLIKRFELRALDGSHITPLPKEPAYKRYLLGGSLFGLGWAMTGACPGPIVALIGSGYSAFLVVLASALLGTWTYGVVRHWLPH